MMFGQIRFSLGLIVLALGSIQLAHAQGVATGGTAVPARSLPAGMKPHVYPEVDTGHTAEKFKQPRLLYWNRGDGQFFDLSAQGGPGITDAHLKSADFFDVEKFPALHFKSESVSIVRNGELAVEGDLTIHGVTHKVRFAVGGPTQPRKDPWGNTRVAVSATTKINRKDFGLTWNAALETGGILVGDDVTITLDVEFVKA